MVNAIDGATGLVLKKVIPVRLIRNEFFQRVKELEDRGASREELMKLLGRGRAKLGMFEGDDKEGELEIGQISGLIKKVMPAAKIVEEIITEFEENRVKLSNKQF